MTLLIKGVLSPKNLSGPIGVIKGASDSVNKGMDAVIDFAIILSVGLAIFNLLPIPVLDGGHLLLMFIETVLRRPLKEAEMLIANRVGLVFVLGLMVFALGNDVTRLIFG
jgi:regulator of sigma E protease